MRLPRLLLALMLTLPFAAACDGSAGGGAGGAASASSGTTGAKPVVKSKDGGAQDDAGPDIESTSAGW
jgi:hypothetical protein